MTGSAKRRGEVVKDEKADRRDGDAVRKISWSYWQGRIHSGLLGLEGGMGVRANRWDHT